MKKIIVALAMATFASSAFAVVAGSAHDFNANATYSTNQASRCQYCHIQHNAQTWANTALWALPQTAATLTFYSSGVTALDVRGTRTCLSCHGDGAVGSSQLAAALPATAAVGSDASSLQNDHPVGNTFTVPGASGSGIAGTRGIAAGPITLAYSTFTAGGIYEMECATCHNPHNSRVYTGRKLLAGPGPFDATTNMYTGSADFCNICHTR